jgi:hypothetical protein
VDAKYVNTERMQSLKQAATLLGIDLPKVSCWSGESSKAFSTERLLRFIN